MRRTLCGLACLLLSTFALIIPMPGPALANPTTAPLPPKKQEVPGVAAQRDALKRVNEAYGDEIAKAKNPADKKALSKKLLQSAADMQDDPIARYVLLGIARDLALVGGDAESALAIVATLNPYQTDGLKAKTDALIALAKFNRAPSEALPFVRIMDHAIDEALAAGRYDVAMQLANLAASAAKTTNDEATLARATSRADDVREIEAALPEARKAEDKLLKAPRDPAASLSLGRFEGFIAGRWEQSLPLLAAGSDGDLRSLAQSELARPSEPDKQAELADRWWEQSGKERGLAQRRLREHAIQWYSLALPNLTGLTRTKVDKRLKESQPVPSVAIVNDQGLDLLKQIDLKRDVIHGDWKFKDGRLEIARGSSPAVLQINQSPRKNYKLRLEFQRPSGGDALGVYLPVGKRGGVLVLFRTRQIGLDMVDGKRFDVNETARIVDLDDTNKHTLDIAVSARTADARITVLVDGKEQVNWKGNSSRLQVTPTWAFPAPMTLGLGSWNTSFVISGAWLTTED